MELEYFLTFLNKPMQRESDFGGIFFNSTYISLEGQFVCL